MKLNNRGIAQVVPLIMATAFFSFVFGVLSGHRHSKIAAEKPKPIMVCRGITEPGHVMMDCREKP